MLTTFRRNLLLWVVIFRKSGSLLTTETTVLVHDGCGETKIIDGAGESTVEGQVKLAREMHQWVSGTSPAGI